MELRQLEYFLAIVDHEGLGRAASHLMLSQPTLSQAVRALERELRVTLFHRTGRRLMPTPTGLALLPLARSVVEGVVAIEDAMRRSRVLQEGALTIACSPEMSGEAVAAWASSFTRAFPNVRLDITETDTATELLDHIAAGHAELGFTAAAQMRPGLEFVSLGSQRMMLVRPPGSTIPGAGGPVPLEALTDLPLVVRPADSREDDPVHQAMTEHGISARIGATVPSRASQLTFVLRSGMQAFLPLRMCIAASDAGAQIFETQPTITTDFGVVHRADALGPAAARFVHDLRSALSAWFAEIDAHQRTGLGLVEATIAAREHAV
ncbi:LysR family transcriptional regulator [Janibacter sp. GS2]|uniref:LysR family transcriptional regulator n=1 Tax=Janibacter sp. GS2 TaxID=3442646 RepID=UPI003EB9D570